MKRSLSLLLITTLASPGFCRQDSVSKLNFNFGLEQDILPYVFKGYFLSGWVGANKLRVRASFATSEIPGFYLTEGIKSDEVMAGGISIECFFKEGFNGVWFGPGMGYWVNSYKTMDQASGQNNSFVFSLGGGYNFTIWKRLYASRWLAMHTRVSGARKVKYGEYQYIPARFTPEVSY
ncbi:MAG: hypothetical protein JKY42_02690 [Flavobacteriales bacterium]|nr:hypothetical protein [Flavobacteriales bacterium]